MKRELAAASAVTALILAACGDDDQADQAARDGTASADVEQFMHIHGLAVAPWASDEVWVSTHQGLLQIDAEGAWSYASDDLHDFMGFDVNPSETDVVYTSGHPDPEGDLENPLGFMVSEDAGRTWEERSLHGEVDFHALTVHGADGNVIYGFDATGHRLLSSDDGGHEWEERTLPHPEGVVALAAHPTDAASVLASTPEGLVRSTDSGDTWEEVLTDVPLGGVAYDPSDPERILAFVAPPGAGPAGEGLLESTDAGESWEALDLDLDDGDLVLHIAVHPTDGDIIYVGTVGESLYGSSDGGEAWEQLASHGDPGGEDT